MGVNYLYISSFKVFIKLRKDNLEIQYNYEYFSDYVTIVTLSVEKIPVVLGPVIKLLVKSMASIGTQEIRRKPKFKNFIDLGEILKRLARNYR